MSLGARSLQEEVLSNLKRFDHIEMNGTELRPAAVCVAVACLDHGPVLWLTQRTPSLHAHAGQYALPGGKVETGETAAAAALRELREELGIAASSSEIIGRLDDFATRSGYVITPFVVWVGTPTRPPRCNPSEVAVLYNVTMEEVDAEPRFIRIPESDRPVIQWPFRGEFIHAPTAAILYQFREIALHGRQSRVAHFEQPVFAWR